MFTLTQTVVTYMSYIDYNLPTNQNTALEFRLSFRPHSQNTKDSTRLRRSIKTKNLFKAVLLKNSLKKVPSECDGTESYRRRTNTQLFPKSLCKLCFQIYVSNFYLIFM